MIFFSKYVFASSDENQDISNYKITYVNRSIMSCGNSAQQDVYTSLDIQAILLISNAISKHHVPLTTDWNTFEPLALGISDRKGLDERNRPDDERRILFLCFAWDEATRLNLFSLSDQEIQMNLNKIKKERPWKNLSFNTVQRMDRLSDAQLKKFIQIVLKADAFEEIRGGINKNPSLLYIPFMWRVPIKLE
jgi:hypothetical protein